MFGVIGKTEPLKDRDQTYFGNSQKTLTSKNLSTSLNFSGNHRTQTRDPERPASAMASITNETSEKAPSLEELEFTLSKLKSDIKNLNDSLEENYAKSRVFARDSSYYDENKYIDEFTKENTQTYEQDETLTMLLRRKDDEAVSHLPPEDSTWFRDPRHLSTSIGDFEASESKGVRPKMVSPRNRGAGIFGAEMATKNVDGQLTSSGLAASMETFPVRLTAPHIVGIRSLLPPKFPVKEQRPTTGSKGNSSEVTVVPHFPVRAPVKARSKTPDPKPRWMPVSWNTNACSQPPPELKQSKQRPGQRPTSAPKNTGLFAQGRSVTHHKSLSSGTYPRQIHPLPSETELRFLSSADKIDTRRALVENSPYQQELARLRLHRLRVEEEYLLQLKRESELERIRGPKPKWYEMTGPEFHYECNKNTTLHKNRKSWSKILQYRNDLLQSAEDFAQSI